MLDDPRFSRLLSAAARLSEHALDYHRFIDKRVLLTGEAATLKTTNGRECMLSSLRLLVRICPNLSVATPACAGSLCKECQVVAGKMTFGKAVEFVDGSPEFAKYDAILSVGSAVRPDLPWTAINSNGWLARVSSGTSSLSGVCDLANPIGALAAACLGVGDVFKRLLQLKQSRGRLLEGLAFSLYSYRCGQTDFGPALPSDVPLDLLLVGAGAIGTGIVHLLSQLPVSGRVSIVDTQCFREENLGTCLIIGPGNLGTPKATFAEMVLGCRVQANGFHEELGRFKQRLGAELPYPRVILIGVDNIEARHEAQSLWPDLIIDGAIGDFPCHVSRHRCGEESACLVCLFRHMPGPAAEIVQSRATGLSPSRVLQPVATVSDDDVRDAPGNRQKWLRERIGRPICSVVSEGVAQEISQENQRKGFAPSVPFVACLSACMVVGELVKSAVGWPTTLETRFKFDVLSGPTFGSMFPQHKRRDCECVTRAKNIDAWRSQRAERGPSQLAGESAP